MAGRAGGGSLAAGLGSVCPFVPWWLQFGRGIYPVPPVPAASSPCGALPCLQKYGVVSPPSFLLALRNANIFWCGGFQLAPFGQKPLPTPAGREAAGSAQAEPLPGGGGCGRSRGEDFGGCVSGKDRTPRSRGSSSWGRSGALHALCSPVEGLPAERRQQVLRCDREPSRGGRTVSALRLPGGQPCRGGPPGMDAAAPHPCSSLL